MYLLVAVELASLARKRLSKRMWRLTHTSSFPLFVLATLHGLTAGTDVGNPWLQVVMVLSVVAVALLTVVRVVGRRHGPDGGLPRHRRSRRRRHAVGRHAVGECR